MGSSYNSKNNAKNENEPRKLYIDLLNENKVIQPEDFIGNKIKTTKYTM